MLFVLLQFFFRNNEYNCIYKLVVIIDNLESETQKTILRTLLYTPIIGLGMIIRFCWNRLCSSEKQEEKKKEYASKFDERNYQ